MDFITELETQLLEYYKPSEAKNIADIATIVLQRYEVQPKQQGLIKYESNDIEYMQNFFVAKVTEGLSERTLRYYKYILGNALPTFNKHLVDITTNDIRAYLVRRKLKGCSETTQNNERRVLSTFFEFLRNEGKIDKNPVSRIAKIKEPKKIKKPLNDMQLETLKLKAGLREKAIIEFLYSTGCRVSEMCNLDRNDIDFERGEAIVYGKGKKYRTVFLTSKSILYLKEYLSQRQDNEPPLFVGKQKPHKRLAKGRVEQLLRELGRKCGIDKVHPHRLRRTCATMALHRGMPIDQVRLMLGHERIDTTTIYAEESIEVVKQSHAKYL